MARPCYGQTLIDMYQQRSAMQHVYHHLAVTLPQCRRMPSLNELKAFEAAAHNGWWPRLALLARLKCWDLCAVSQAVLGSGCIAIRSALFGPPCFRAECGYTGTDFRKIEIRVARSLKRAGSIRAQKRRRIRCIRIVRGNGNWQLGSASGHCSEYHLIRNDRPRS